MSESNQRPGGYKAPALPTELIQHINNTKPGVLPNVFITYRRKLFPNGTYLEWDYFVLYASEKLQAANVLSEPHLHPLQFGYGFGHRFH